MLDNDLRDLSFIADVTVWGVIQKEIYVYVY